MRPRYYSVPSSPTVSPDAVDALDLVVAAAPTSHRSGEGTFLQAART
ncbi:hypothetical protein [Streptomyces sp. NPDC093149]